MPNFPPSLTDAMRQVGALLQAGNFQEAHARLQVVVKHHPDCAEALRLLAALHQTRGDVEQAEALLRKALTVDPGWAPTLVTLGELLLGNGRDEEAEPLLRRAATRLPHAAWLLARHCNDRQRPAEALALLAPWCTAGHINAELATQHVAVLAALGRQDEAIEHYRHMSEAAPDNPAAAHALAMALASAQRHAEAEHAIQSALARASSNPAIHFTHARTLVAQGEYEHAEAALHDVLRLNPHHVEAHDHLARLTWMRTGDITQTTAMLDAALQKFAGDETLLAAKAAILQGAGDARGAFDCLAETVSHPQAKPALLVRAGLSALDFNPAAALALAERVLHQSPSHMPAHSLMAAALLGVGDARQALTHCETLLAASPDDQYLIALQTTAWRMLGDARHDAYCDHPKLVQTYALPVPSGWTHLADFLTDLKHSLEALHDPHGHPLLFQSLRHGTETTENLAQHTDPTIQALFTAFDAPIRDYMAHLGHASDPLRRRNHGSYRFNGSWSVRLRDAGFHANHVHPRGWISSAFYVDLPEGMADATTPDGCLSFGQPGIVTSPPLPAQHMVRPQAGMLALFPSYVWHGTAPFHGKQTRLTVAFDAVPKT